MNEKFLKLGKYKDQEGIFQGKVVQYKSYIPKKLNEPYEWSNKKINILLEEATRLLGELNAYSELIPDIDIFIKMHIIKEATESSRIEGTRTSIDEAILLEEDISPEKINDWVEVQNYINAMNFAISELNKIPISQRLIKYTHQTLLTGVRGDNKSPGEYRRIQNWIGASTIEYARFIPPCHTELNNLLYDLEEFWHNDSLEIPLLIKIALFHYQFETIHPFLDGNGRVGRLLITLQLIDKNFLSKPTLYLSDFFEKNRVSYYEMLSRVKIDDSFDDWVIFFLQGVKETSTKGKNTLKSIISLKEKTQTQIAALGGKKYPKAQCLLNYLFTKPIVDTAETSEVLECSYNSAASIINDFISYKILQEYSKKGRGRKFAFAEYLNLF